MNEDTFLSLFCWLSLVFVVACRLSCPMACGILVLWPGIELTLPCSGSTEPETLDHQRSLDHCYSFSLAGLSCCPSGRPPALELLLFLLILSFSLPVSGSASSFSLPGSYYLTKFLLLFFSSSPYNKGGQSWHWLWETLLYLLTPAWRTGSESDCSLDS